MSWTTKLFAIANPTIDFREIRDAIVKRVAAGPMHVTLVAPASSGAGCVTARRTATEQRLEGAVQRLREAGVTVDGVVGRLTRSSPWPMRGTRGALTRSSS